MHAKPEPRYWVVAEFPTGDDLLSACKTARESGHTDIDTHSTFPLHRAEEALGLKRSKVPLIALVGGITGGLGGLVMQWWMNGVDFPLNIGNRPGFSAPAAIPITFECTVLLCALSIFFGILALSRLPQPYHPAFEAEEFRSHSTHGYWLSIAVAKDKNKDAVAEQIRGLGAAQVSVIEEQVE